MGRWSVVGVTSFGIPDCEFNGVPDVFVRVDAHLDFIYESVNLR